MTRFEVTGRLQLYSQEGGYADDAFILLDMDDGGSLALDDAVAEHFSVAKNRDGNRDIGRVRITIERIDEATNT